MMEQLNAVRRLLPVLKAQFDALQFEMGQLSRRTSELRAQLQDLERPRSAEHPLSASDLAGADVRWHAWSVERKKLINQELARTMAQAEVKRSEMRMKLGKLEAAKQIENRLASTAAMQKERRASW